MTTLSVHIRPQALHHAYLLAGDRRRAVDSVRVFLQDEAGVVLAGNPDFFEQEYETISIDDARMLFDLHLRKSFAGTRRFFLISGQGITIEAQNALLKLFEEPAAQTHFFLVLSDARTILPTLRSRMVCIDLFEKEEGSEDFGRTFLNASLSKRLRLVGEIAEGKDKEKARRLIRSLIEAVRADVKEDDRGLLRTLPVLEDLIRTDDYLSDRSPSLKMLLEHIAHIAPFSR